MRVRRTVKVADNCPYRRCCVIQGHRSGAYRHSHRHSEPKNNRFHVQSRSESCERGRPSVHHRHVADASHHRQCRHVEVAAQPPIGTPRRNQNPLRRNHSDFSAMVPLLGFIPLPSASVSLSRPQYRMRLPVQVLHVKASRRENARLASAFRFSS